MKESDFSSHIREDIYFHLTKPEKIKDGVVLKKRRTPHVELMRDSHNSGKKPYDFYFVHRKGFVAVELKWEKGQSVNFSIVSKHQVEALYEAEHCSPLASGYIIIGLENYDGGHKAIVIPVYNWTRIVKANKDKKSIKINELLEKYANYVNVMERVKVENHLHWDIKGGIINFERY